MKKEIIFKKKSQITIFIIFGIVILSIFALIFYIRNYVIEKELEKGKLLLIKPKRNVSLPESEPSIDVCSDGTFYGSCSSNKPYYCFNGDLIEDCAECGCDTGSCQDGGSCKEAKDFTIFFVPVNYVYDDSDFRARVDAYEYFIREHTILDDDNFVVVDETYSAVGDCSYYADLIRNFVDSWHQRKYGVALDGVSYDDAIPVYNYRVIGIDRKIQDMNICGCGYITDIYGVAVYIGGHSCSWQTHIAMHELGHSFGLCDEYDTYVWDDTNGVMNNDFRTDCENSKPNSANSDCGDSCNCAMLCDDSCQEECGFACCNGKYADSLADNYFNIMGSADTPPSRRLSSETKGVIDSYLCLYFDIC